ncbi:reverse transcriptase domain-containing protein [Tanacetum coccineum]
MVYKDLLRRPRDKHVPRPAARQGENHRLPRDSFTTLVKTPTEILATSEGKTMLRSPPKMFTPSNKRDQTRYCEFHEDHGHDTNDCIDLPKDIKACVRKGRMAHLAKGAKTQNNNQNNQPSESKDNSNPQIGWSKKIDTETKPKNKIHMIQAVSANTDRARILFPDITFSEDDPIPEHCTGDNPLIITANVGTTHIHRIYVDGGSSAEIMYEHCFEQLTPEEKKQIRPSTAPLVGFAGQISWPLGLITLPVTVRDYRGHVSKTITAEFMIIRAPSPYNIILGWPGMMKLGAVASTLHALLKFETQGGVAVVRGKRFQRQICGQVSRKRDHPDEGNDTEGIEHIIVNDAYPEQPLQIAANLHKMLKEKLCEFLRLNKDIFAWKPADMTGIPRELAEHKLNIHPRTFPVWQKKRIIARE